MRQSHFFLVALTTTSLAVGVTSFRSGVPAISRVGSVSPAAPMLEPRSGHTATLLPGGKVLIAGGMRRNQDFYRSAELFDPATGRFTAISKMTTKRGQPSGTLLANGDVLIAGGADHDSPGGMVSAEILRASTLTFEPAGSMHHARISHTAMLLDDGRVLIAGGRGESVTAGAELYDPKTRRFTETGSMFTARYKHTAGVLPDGRVLIAGGSNDQDWRGTMSSAEVYDPRSGRFKATSPLNDNRFKLPDEAVHLSSGRVLISGGSTKVEIYDPESGKFLIASGQMNDTWHFMSETLLKDGTVLLAGGYSNNDRGTAQTWIFRP